MQEKSAGAVIFRIEEGKRIYLVLHYAGGHWEFVKGKIENDENLKETVERECEEETGISDLQFVDGFEEKIEYFFHKDGNNIRKEVIFFLAESMTEEVKLSHEHQDHAWMPFEVALERLTFDNAKRVLEAAENFLSGF